MAYATRSRKEVNDARVSNAAWRSATRGAERGARAHAPRSAARLAPGVTPETLAGINPNDPVEPVAEQLRGWSEDTLVAGHQPFMSKLVAPLIAGRAEPPVVDYRPGSVACLERDARGGWVLAWMVRPELLAGGAPP